MLQPEFPPYAATNKPETCLWCGQKLEGEVSDEGQDSESQNDESQNDGYFCGLRCAYPFAVLVAKTGKRYKPAPKRFSHLL